MSPLGNSLPERLLAEAEVVKALTEVLEDIGPATGAYEVLPWPIQLSLPIVEPTSSYNCFLCDVCYVLQVRISHNSLLQGAMQYIGATKEQQPRAMELLVWLPTLRNPFGARISLCL